MAKTGYDVFLSYSHSWDAVVAPTLKRALEQFAKPWTRARAMQVFRDNASLSASSGLWSSIQLALSRSEWLVLLASPRSAESVWVGREITWWLQHRSADRILLVVTDGEIRWDEVARDFDRARSTAVSPALHGAFREEPREVDLRWLHDADQVSLSNPRLQENVADIVATVRDRPKDEIIGEHVHQHRRTMRYARGGVTSLVILFLLAVLGAVYAQFQAGVAQQRARIATSRALAAESGGLADRDPRLSALTAVMAHRLDPTAQSAAALMQGIDRLRHVTRFLEVAHGRGTSVPRAVALSPDGNHAALPMSDDDSIHLWNLDTGELRVLEAKNSASSLTHASAAPEVSFSSDGAKLVASEFTESIVSVWDVRTGKRSAEIPVSEQASLWGVSEDGRSALLGEFSSSSMTTTLRIVDLEEPESSPGVQGEAMEFPIVDGARTVMLPDGAAVRFPARQDAAPLEGTESPTSVVSADRTAEVSLSFGRLEWRDLAGQVESTSEALASGGQWSRIALSGNGQTAALGDDRGRVVSVSRTSGRVTELVTLPNVVMDLAVDATGDRVVAADALGNAVSAAPRADARLTELPGTAGYSASGDEVDEQVREVSPDGRWAALARAGRIQLWDLAQRRRLGEFEDFGGFSADSRAFAIPTTAGIELMGLPNLDVVRRIDTGGAPGGEPSAMAEALGRWELVETGHPAAAAWHEQRPRKFLAVDEDGGRRELTADRFPGVVPGASGTLLTEDSDDASGTGPSTLTSWDRSGARPSEIGRRTTESTAEAISSDGRFAVVSGPAGAGSIDMTDSGSWVPFTGGYGRGSVTEYAFLSDPNFVVQHVTPQREENTYRNRLLVWHRQSGTLIGEWEEPLDAVPDSKPVEIAAAGGDVITIRPNGAVALWRTSSEAWAVHLCDMVGPPTREEQEQFLSGFDIDSVCG